MRSCGGRWDGVDYSTRQWLWSYMKGTQGGVLSVWRRRVLSWTGMGQGGGHASGRRVPAHGAFSARHMRGNDYVVA
jgi:hypothetical protein